jgi:3-oxoacyl-[acyl-carrier protein] reductase
MDLQLKDKNVVITGGTKGIGLAVAKAFLAEGAIVHVISRGNDLEGFGDLKDEALFNRLYGYQCDVTDENALLAVRTEILLRTGNTIDIVIANVGSGKSPNNAINEKELWSRNWDLNFTAALNTARIFTPYITKESGSILFVSSIAGMEYLGAPTDYSVAKSALISFSKTLSHKLAPDARVNVVAPGNIFFTGGTWDLKIKEDAEKVNAMLNNKVPLRRLGRPEEVAAVILFLSSTCASFITGGCFVVDGGQTTAF